MVENRGFEGKEEPIYRFSGLLHRKRNRNPGLYLEIRGKYQGF